MKTLFYILILLTILLSCQNTTKVIRTKDLFFYTNSNNIANKLDSITIDEIPHHNSQDSLLASQDFELNGKKHIIKMYTSDFYASIDGGNLTYEIDNLGVFYGRSTTWYSYNRLKSNNDSINKIIDAAIENTLLYSKLSYNSFKSIITTDTVEFSPPTVDE